METFLHDPAVLWFALGAFLIVFEACTVPGLGVFLLGLGALCTALLIKLGVVSETEQAMQLAWVLGLTVLWTAALWKPLQKFRTRRKTSSGAEYNNLVGNSAVVASGGLQRGRTGQVAWSGTLMSAEFDASSPADALPEGAGVIITAVSGTTLKVMPK